MLRKSNYDLNFVSHWMGNDMIWLPKMCHNTLKILKRKSTRILFISQVGAKWLKITFSREKKIYFLDATGCQLQLKRKYYYFIDVHPETDWIEFLWVWNVFILCISSVFSSLFLLFSENKNPFYSILFSKCCSFPQIFFNNLFLFP